VRRSIALLVVALLIAVALWRRSGGETVMMPYVRLVDLAARSRAGVAAAPSVSTVDLPTVSIADETRYVLQPLRHDTLVHADDVHVDSDGRISFRVPLPKRLHGADRVVLVSYVHEDQHWQPLPALPLLTQGAGDDRNVAFGLTLRRAAGRAIGVYVEGYAIAPDWNEPQPTQEIDMPPHAELRFGIGIAPPAWRQGPVRFEIQSCRAAACESIFAETLDPAGAEGRLWQDRSVSLAKWAGQRRSFRFSARLVHDDGGGFSFPRWANPTVYAPKPPPARSLNVILLSIDTLRADHLTTYGYEHDTAPFIDETFGKGGTVFEHCVAAAVTTPPSHMTMLTSLPPCVHGLKTGLEVIPDWVITLAEEMRAGGFATGAVTEDGWLGIEHGFGRGFNVYAENKSPDIMTPVGQVEHTFARAETWLARHREQRFFLFLHTFQVHSPYTPPPRYQSLFASHDGQPVTADSRRNLRDAANYDREIRYTDDQLRRLFATITALGLQKNTIFLLTSDHGEEFLEHGYWQHGAHLYEETTHVPLMAWGPGHVVAGRRIAEPVGHVDLMPTILALAGLPPAAQAQGTSLAPLLAGAAFPPHPSRTLFSEAWGNKADDHYRPIDVEPPSYLAQDGPFKLARYRRADGFVYEYYDLTADPGERTNTYAGKTSEAAPLRAAVDAYERNCQAIELAVRRHPDAIAETTPHRALLQPEEEEKLRALGYLR